MEFKISSFLENENYNFNRKKIFNNLPEKYIEDAINTITTWDNYKPTSIKNLDLLANNYSVKNIYYKDEGERFDLKSFKALGGAFAVDKVSKNKKEITVATVLNPLETLSVYEPGGIGGCAGGDHRYFPNTHYRMRAAI